MVNEVHGSGERIVVGIDGSESSLAALAWAQRQASLTGAALEVVTAWEYPTTFGWSIALPEELDLSREAATMLAAAVDRVLGTPPSIKPTETVVEGHPTLALLEVSARCDLLVVGCRGMGALKGMLVGSVSGYLASHAHCPVVIVHDHDDRPHAP